MILLALFSWTILFYFSINKYTLLNFWLLKIGLSFVLVVSLTSFFYFLSLIGHLNFFFFQIIFTSIPIILFLYFLLPLQSIKYKKQKNPKLPNSLLIILFSCFIIFTWNFFRITSRWGEWDSWAIWTLHAKFLTFENSFSNLFTNQIGWTHPDYPLMLSSIIAVFWKSFNNYSPITPVIISYLICVSILIITMASFIEKFHIKRGLIYLIIFSTSLNLNDYGSSQYSDSLLCLFILIPFILINHIPKQGNNFILFLIGFFAASSGWIKNEGIAFFIIFSFFFFIYKDRNKKTIKSYILGALFPITVIAIFKIYFAPANEIVIVQNETFYLKIFDFNRHVTIIRYFIFYIISKSPLLLILTIISIVKFNYFKSFSFIVIASLLLSYYIIYLLTPYDLNWHLSTSFGRLLYQISPALIYTIFSQKNSSKICCSF